MKRILLLIFVLTNSYIAKSDGYMCYPLFNSFNQINYVVKATILEKTCYENTETCENGKIINHPNTYLYKSRLINNLYGNINDTIFNSTYNDPDFHEYNDSCEITVSFWLFTSLRGIERDLNQGDEVHLCLDHSHRIIAAIKTVTELDSFFFDHIAELKNVDKYKIGIANSNAIGETINKDFCLVDFIYDPNIEDYIPLVTILNNGNIIKLRSQPVCDLVNIDPTVLWKFKISQKKILIYNKNIKYKLLID